MLNSKDYKYTIFALFLFWVLGFLVSFALAQGQIDTATERLLTISESMTSSDMAEIQNLINAGADVNVRDKGNFTPLFAASRMGYPEIVKLLLGAGAAVNAASTNGATSLFVASRSGFTDIVKLLLDAKADVHASVRIEGVDYTPMKIATMNKHEGVIDLLNQYGVR